MARKAPEQIPNYSGRDRDKGPIVQPMTPPAKKFKPMKPPKPIQPPKPVPITPTRPGKPI